MRDGERLNGREKEKIMAAPVWVLSVDLKTNTATFQSGMSEAAKSARGSFSDIKSGAGEMGTHVNTNMFAARHSVMALSEAFGGQLPRAITAFIAHIGPLGAVLEAAFPFAAIGLGAVLLIEHLQKLKEEGIKLTEDQVKFGTAVQMAFNSLDQKLLTAGIRADELRNDHLGALHLQLQLIDRQSMAELVHSFGEVAKAADTVFADLKTSWYQFGVGSGGAKHALDQFQNKYDSLLAQGKDSEASDLLKGTRDSAEKILELQNLRNSKKFTTSEDGSGMPTILAGRQAEIELKKAGVGWTEKEIKAQQILLEALNSQETIEVKVAALKKADSGNATTATGKEGAGLRAEGAKQAAEHAQKMGELALEIQRDQANESNAINENTINQRLMSDMRLANEEYAIEQQASAAKIAALDKGGKDYNNQLKALQDKEEETTLKHTVALGALLSKAREATHRQELQELELSEREKIEATDTGSQERLQAIDAALKEEKAKGLEQTTFYRDLQKERVQVQKQADDEIAKASAEAGKEQADNALKMGELRLAAEQQFLALANSSHHLSIQQRMQQEIQAANEEQALKMAAMSQEIAALDKSGKDYQNKLKALQDKERQLVQQHENEITAIKDQAMIDRNTRILSAEEQFNDTIVSGLTQVLMGHQSFAAMMEGLTSEVAASLMQAAIKHVEANLLTKQSDAGAAAASAYKIGLSMGGPAGMILGPVFAATAYAGVMAFNTGTDGVPGVGHGDTVPAMLTPGEGVVPGGVMDGLRKMVRSGGMGGAPTYHVHHSPTYHVQTIDGNGVREMLKKHSDEFARHVHAELRKGNR